MRLTGWFCTAWAFFAPLSTVGCGSSDEGDATLRVTVASSLDAAPLAGALLSIEQGGLYLPNSDTSKGNPHYTLGGRAGNDGVISLSVPQGATLGLHAFALDFLYAPRKVVADGDVSLTIKPLPRDATLAKPTLANARAEPASVGPGESFEIIADAAAGAADDPLSDETLLVEPWTHRTAALDPPSPGVQGQGYPDGTYRLTRTAPGKTGSYSYWVVTTTEGCVTGDPVEVVLEVK
jgi:hypothetical protein